MPGHLYRFRNVWTVNAPANDVMKTLVDVNSYPRWWRDIRAVRQIDEDSGFARCRAVLPYALDLHLRRAEENIEAGRLRVDLGGDLDGYCGALVDGHGAWTIVRISQEVTLRKPRLTRVEPVLRPLLRANHAAMMWRGERGLRAFLRAS